MLALTGAVATSAGILMLGSVLMTRNTFSEIERERIRAAGSDRVKREAAMAMIDRPSIGCSERRISLAMLCSRSQPSRPASSWLAYKLIDMQIWTSQRAVVDADKDRCSRHTRRLVASVLPQGPHRDREQAVFESHR